ncbi:MAG: hypothetical protein Q8P50_17255 [Bacillota bacterium]|nr:hypothetical protein [Bacillota bacterium]
MKRYILDSSAIIAQPSTTSFRSPDADLVVPDVVVDELRRWDSLPSSGSLYGPLIDRALSSGTLSIGPTGPVGPPDYSAGLPSGSTGPTPYQYRHGPTGPTGPDTDRGVPYYGPVAPDVGLLSYAQAQRAAKSGDDIIVVTLDQAMARKARAQGFGVAKPQEFLDDARSNATPVPEVTKVVDQIGRFQTKHLALSALGGSAAAVAANLCWAFRGPILDTMNAWGTVSVIALAAIGLYALRSYRRAAYGLGEVVVGLAGAIQVLLPDFDVLHIDSLTSLQLIAALYVMVRGLDDFAKGMDGTPIGFAWRRWFPA